MAPGIDARMSMNNAVEKAITASTLDGASVYMSSNNPPQDSSTSTLTPYTFALDNIHDALNDFAAGNFLVVVDDEDRENEGDLIIAASSLSTEKMAFMIKYTSGLICVPMTSERLDQLQLPLMVPNNQEKHKTAYTVSVDYKTYTTTGISAHDRALTITKLSDPTSSPTEFARPGHVFPLRAREGGVLVRKGHTEAAVDLCRLTNIEPIAAICELLKLNDPMGNMARRDDCRRFADAFGLKMISIEQIQRYRIENGL